MIEKRAEKIKKQQRKQNQDISTKRRKGREKLYMVHEIRITTTWKDKNQIKKNADKSNTRRSWRRGNKKGKKIEKRC